ncbi:hypothetical protein ACFQW6_03480 [Nocardioides sp. GCM10028917]|uniref:hypothetical protein n=1 Tax=Nocardioides sp. GCM10028917 TaxID=3273408 RepID=UPI003610E2B8
MPDLDNRIREAALPRDHTPRWWAPWLLLAIATSLPASFAVSMLMPYYVNDLDRFPLDEMPWGIDYMELWPYDTAWSFPVGLAGIYAIVAGPMVAIGILLWVGFWWSARGGAATWTARVVTMLAVAITVSTITWLVTSSLASTLVSWFLD